MISPFGPPPPPVPRDWATIPWALPVAALVVLIAPLLVIWIAPPVASALSIGPLPLCEVALMPCPPEPDIVMAPILVMEMPPPLPAWPALPKKPEAPLPPAVKAKMPTDESPGLLICAALVIEMTPPSPPLPPLLMLKAPVPAPLVTEIPRAVPVIWIVVLLSVVTARGLPVAPLLPVSGAALAPN